MQNRDDYTLTKGEEVKQQSFPPLSSDDILKALLRN